MKRLHPTPERSTITIRFTAGSVDAVEARPRLHALAEALGRQVARLAWEEATAADQGIPAITESDHVDQ